MPGDYIAFGFNYHGGEHDTIEVSNITSIRENEALVHFMYGHHSLAEYIKFDDIIAIGNENGKTKIRGWNGYFDLIKLPTSKKIISDIEDRLA